MQYQGLGPAQSVIILLILLALAFAPRLISLALQRDKADLQQEQDEGTLPVEMTPVQALARHMYGEAYGWGTLDMLNYDHTPWVREPWERSASAKLDRAPQRQNPNG